MKLIKVDKNLNLKIVNWKPNRSEHQTISVFFDVNTARIIGVPCRGQPVAPYTPVGGYRALESILSPEGGFVEGTLLYGFPTIHICDDIFTLDEFSLRAVRELKCTCCGGIFRGRQWHNQDIGWSLGPCCEDRCKRNISEEEFISTYGVDGYNRNVAE